MSLSERKGVTIVELLVVLAIIGLLVGLLLPAVQSARERAREAVCKNNLRQINLAIAHFAQAHKRLPPASLPGTVGGWMVDILPFIEQQSLKDTIPIETPIEDVSESLLRPPVILQCPRSTALDATPAGAPWRGHYVLVRKPFSVYDAPVDLDVPWLSGPEMDVVAIRAAKGPHRDGFFYARGLQQGVGFMLNGVDVAPGL